MRLTLASGVGLTLGACRSRGAAPVQERTRPRYVVALLLAGGHDTLYTTDPKTPREVEPWVGLPAKNDLAEVSSLRLGTAWKALSPWADRLSFVNGVQVGTANHDTGYMQFVRLKSNVVRTMPGVLDIIGSFREEQPVGAVYLNLSLPSEHSPRFFGTTYRPDLVAGPLDPIERAEATDPEGLKQLADEMRRAARELESRMPAWEGAMAAENLTGAADLLGRLATVPELEHRPMKDAADEMASRLDRALWLLEHDLTACVFVDMMTGGWDSHAKNEQTQTEMNNAFATALADFLRRLGKRSNRFGSLADNTIVLGGSELGRYPRVNDLLGKDHLPQAGYFMIGPGVARGRVAGGTGRQMEGLPVSLRTGTPDQTGRQIFLDDIGTTLLHRMGVAPERYGYAGRVCEFLLG